MTALPIVGRELGVAARRRATYWMRPSAALGLLAFYVILRGSRQIYSGGMARHLLNGMGIVVFAFSLLAGMFLTSDCLSCEKRDGTLGLLFLTDLKSYDIVLGKMAANSLHAFYGLMAVFPVLALPLLVGGVTGEEFARLLLVFMVTIFFSLSAGMLVSAVSQEAKQSLLGTFLVLVVFTGIFPVLWWAQSLLVNRVGLDFLLWPSPANTYMRAFDSAYRTKFGAEDFWRSLGTIFFLGLGSLGWTIYLLPRAWQETGWFPFLRRGTKQSGTKQTARPRLRLINENPFYWLAARDSGTQRVCRMVLMVLVPIWGLFLFLSATVSARNHVPFIICFFTAYGMHFVVKVLLAAEASRRLQHDRQSGALELLLATPISVEAILEGQSRALHTLFRGAWWTLGLVNAGLIAAIFLFSKQLDIRGDDQWMFFEMFFGGIVMLGFDFKALSRVGMWQGLRAKQHHRAVLWTVLQIMSLPIAVVFVLALLQPGGGKGTFIFVMTSWFVGCAIIDLISAAGAARRLKEGFRLMVTERFERK